MIIDKLVVLELIAIADLTDAHKKQVRSYLKATQLDLGILINFATPSVQYKRIANERDTQISKNP